MTEKQLLAVVRNCESIYDRERGREETASGKEYREIIGSLENENLHSLALLLNHYHFTGARVYIKGLFA